MRYTALALLTIAALQANAKIKVTQTTCNYQKGLAVVQGDIKLGWMMASDVDNDRQTAYQIVVTENVSGKTVFDSKRQKRDWSQFVAIPKLQPNKRGYLLKVRVWDRFGKPSAWSAQQPVRVVDESIMNGGDKDAFPQWICAITKKDARLPEGRFSNAEFKKDYFKEKWASADTLSARSIIMRKEFSNEGKKVVDAVAYISGMGHYEMRINGKKVGDSEFAPLWSEYSKTIYYNTYDVTHLLNSGSNAIGVMLGNGFFNVQRGNRYSKLMTSFGTPQMIMRLVVNYSDGTSKTIVSDPTWRYTLGPVTFNSIYGGESYDARLACQGFDRAGYDDSSWKRTVVQDCASLGCLVPQTAQPVKIMERWGIKSWQYLPADSVASASAKTKRQVSPHTFIADMGQNLAGFPEIRVKGRPGQKVTMLVAENLNKQGVCDQRQTGRQHYYEYTIGSDSVETWHPRFSYYGFRYIQVEDAVLEGEPNPDGLPVLKGLESCFIYNSAEEGSAFECSNPLFTQTHRLIERAERSNMQSVMSDCPHREKLGWLEQDHLVGPSLFYNYDMTQFCPKIIRDITDTQKQDGMVPTTAPQYVSFGNLFDDSPEWGSTLIIMPFQYYEQYGDSSLIVSNYDAMRRYVDYLTQRSSGGIVSHGLGDWYDVVEGKAGFCHNTPIPLVATAHYIYDLQLLQKAARMTGRTSDERKYAALYSDVVAAFNREFYHPDSCSYGSGSQTSNALPLFLGICGENKEKVLRSLIEDIRRHGNRLTTGDVGNRYLFMTLMQTGNDELLYRMLNHYDTPGYGFQIRQGATTLTEQWNPRQGSSWNHLMMGQIDEWLFKRLGGIQNKPGTYGMRHLLIEPTLVGDLTHVKAATTTLYGRVEVERRGDSVSVSIPVGCDATVVLPSGKRVEVGSGVYNF